MRGLCYFFLSILTQVSSSTLKVIGFFGHNVTLPCSYDTQTNGVLSVCWGRGMLPTFKCSDTILSSENGVVVFRESSRYQLLGRVADGDVTLTIQDAQWSDAGVYGCRIEIPGLFNDEKINTELVLEEAPTEQPVTQDWTLTTDGRQDISTASTPHSVDEPTEGKFKAFLEVGNISRAAVVFFFGIIIILVFVYRRRFLPKRTLQHLNAPTAENIYEVSQ